MDDLAVIRLVAMDNITRGRIARARMEVKENFGDRGGGGLPGPSTGFLLVRGISFAGETPVPWKRSENWQAGFHGCLLISRRNLCLRKEDWNR